MTEFEEIYRAYFHQVYRYLCRLTREEHLAEELTSETFLKALQAIGSFRGECDIRVWLCQIAKNTYLSYLGKAGRTESREDLDCLLIPDPSETAEERLARQEEVLRIQKVLHGLPETYREVFMWRVYAELNFRQIGQIFGKSENWACVTYHRARRRIRDRLEGTDHEK